MNHLIIEAVAMLLSSAAFGIIFNIRGKHLVLSVMGGILSWAVYTFTAGLFSNDIPQYILAAAAISLYCEILARITKTPVPVYLVVGIIPLVPGALIFRTMLAFINADAESFIKQIMYTLTIAGGIALGVFSVSSVFRLFTEEIRRRRR